MWAATAPGSSNIIEIKFLELDDKKKDYCYDEEELSLEKGQKILVETKQGLRFAQISDFLETDEKNVPEEMTKITKKATFKDQEQYKRNRQESKEALKYAIRAAKDLNLDMHFLDSYYTFDRKQLYLSYVADTRVDFRELAKILAQKYKTRIELRQIGVRDKAKKVGGIGPCGLFLCCNTFLKDFTSVSINMAKNQLLALNPSKINGLCGRLLCCLTYEDETYTELKKDLPALGSIVQTKEGAGKVVSLDIFQRSYKVELKNKEQIEVKVNPNETAENHS